MDDIDEACELIIRLRSAFINNVSDPDVDEENLIEEAEAFIERHGQ
jgi:hypothetical protein